ncbi:MAG: UDP-N-acetylmuramate--L-alanine ligase [Calditrichaeota bacterium]|nr:MAG: UDP-N-acetylmuramate--L-alanine ligase [Calditrichota bacterium]
MKRADTIETFTQSFSKERNMFGKIKKLFFVGIGGAGMSGIAEILHNLGYEISGSDNTPSEITEYLSNLGVKIYNSHLASNLNDTEVVVITSAVGEENPEVVEARRLGIPVIKRAEMLGELMRLKFSIGVSGTHGKTTTTSMIGKIMQLGKYEPTLIVGGIVSGLGTGSALGGSQYLVAEADEYDKSFLSMFPSMAVVTNIEPDHLDCYDGEEDLLNSFVSYMNRVPFYGQVVISADDENLQKIKHLIKRPFTTFGFSIDADYRALNIEMVEGRTTFAVYKRGDLLGEIILKVPGEFNILNALAAVASCSELDIPFEIIADGLLEFRGVSRRFEFIGTEKGVTVVDDYAHHPSEIKVTLETAQNIYDKRLIVIYQPHLYSRTRDFKEDFIQALSIADKVLLVDIYPAREEPIPGVTSEQLVIDAQAKGFKQFQYIGNRNNAPKIISEMAQENDLVITMGAGSITLEKQNILNELKK